MSLIQTTFSNKPFKRRAYYIFVALIAFALSGAIAFWAYQPQWKTNFSYQYRAENDLSSAADTGDTADVSSVIEPVTAQLEIMKSDKFLNEIKTSLEQQGLHGWSTSKIAHAIHLSNPGQSNLIEVSVETPQKAVTQKIAMKLDQLYMQYLADLQTDSLQHEQAFLAESLQQAKTELADGKSHIQNTLALGPQVQAAPFASDPNLGEKAMAQNYTDLTHKIKDVETTIAFEGTKYLHYRALLNQNEKTLVEGVILGQDPVLTKIEDRLANAQTEADIVSVKYAPQGADQESGQDKIKTLQHLFDARRHEVLAGHSGYSPPVIRDSLRQQFIQDLMASKIRLLAAQKTYKILNQQRNSVLAQLNQIVGSVGDYNAWLVQKNMLENTISSLNHQLENVVYQQSHLLLPVKHFQPLASSPSAVQDAHHSVVIFLLAFAGLFGMMSAVPLCKDYRSSQIVSQSSFSILQELLKTKGQKIIMTLPVHSSGHLNAATQLGGLLNQFGRDALVMDIDLSHRLLSRKIPLEHPYGVLEHLLSTDIKKPYHDPLSGAKILPLEASLSADKVVEFSQIIQRLPKIWDRWPSSVIILDLSQWHEAYHQLIPYVSEVIFYVPPGHQSNILFPKVFKSKYSVPVSLVDIQPET